MIERVELHLSPSQIADDSLIRKLIGQRLGLDPDSQFYFELKRRSIDARKSVQFILQYDVFIDEKPKKTPRIIDQFAQVKPEKTVLIVGAGPAGYFAALELIKLGIRPIVVDRGKDVQSRRKDLRAIQQFGEVNPDSNYCFGEGGAGTYSDGKLYTRSVKRGDVNSVLQLLVEHGAPSDILIDAYPHIGSNRLPEVVKAIRETIERFGGEVHFDSKVTDLLIFEKEINGVLINNQRELHADAVILATGHSARDIFELLQVKKIQIEAKPFALGVRIEHPQELIDEIQYRQKPRNSNLPAAKYAM
ncbi:MAG: FAD-dependent oxidoreductase, partial [Calditrichaeota bacterium]|nr:FAD-dependent oxidoreductase [Calditrichota bacterium]